MTATSTKLTDSIENYPAEHLRVLGPPGSGKTRLLLARYHALARREGNDRVFVLTYARQQLKQLTQAVIQDGEGHGGSSPVLTYFALAREILTASGQSPPRLIEGMEEALLVRRLVRTFRSDFRSDFAVIHESECFQRELLALFHLLLQNGIRDERLDRVVAETTGARLRDVLSLYGRYVSELDGGGRLTYFDIAWAAARACGDVPAAHPLKQARVFLVDDFQDVDVGQFALLGALAPPEGDTKLNVFGDPMGAFFGFRGTTSRVLMQEFPEKYPGETFQLRTRAIGGSAIAVTLDALAAEVLGADAGAFGCREETPRSPARSDAGWGPLFDGVPGRSGVPARKPPGGAGPETGAGQGVAPLTGAGVSIECVEDEMEETYGAAAHVHELLTKQRYRPGDIAVVTNDKSRYEPLLWAAFLQHGVPLDTGRVRRRSFREFTYALFELLDSPGSGAAMQALTSSPYFEGFRHACLQSIAAEHGRGEESERVAKFLRSISEKMQAKTPPARMAVVIEKCLLPACGRTEDDAVYGFLATLGRRWEEYARSVREADEVGEDVELRTFVRISGLFNAQPAAPAPSPAEVGFYSCREIKGRFFPVVVVLGCSELLFPAPLKREGIMPVASLQKALDAALPAPGVRLYGARSALEHLHKEYHLLYHSLTRATERLQLYSPAQFAGRVHPAPASILNDTLPAEIYTSTARIRRTPPQVSFARDWVRSPETPLLAERLDDLSPLGRLWNLPSLERPVFELERFRISKSSLEAYIACPRQFFYSKVLKVRDEDSAPQYVGKIFHAVLETIGKTFQTKQELHAGCTDPFVTKAIDTAIRSVGAVRPGTFFDRSLRFHMHAMIQSVLRLDQVDTDDYTIETVEELFNFTHQGWEFSGKADRVDRTGDGIVLTDYKSGMFRKRGYTLRTKTLATLEGSPEGNWQVPLYVWWHFSKTGEMPGAFRVLVKQPGADPFSVTIYVRSSEADVPAVAKKRTGGFSYLLVSDIDDIMERAVLHVADIFSPRACFARAESAEPCRTCSFAPVCDRKV